MQYGLWASNIIFYYLLLLNYNRDLIDHHQNQQQRQQKKGTFKKAVNGAKTYYMLSAAKGFVIVCNNKLSK